MIIQNTPDILRLEERTLMNHRVSNLLQIRPNSLEMSVVNTQLK